MSGIYSKRGKRRVTHRGLVSRREERIPLGRPMPSGRIILIWILKITLEEMYWIDMVQDRDK